MWSGSQSTEKCVFCLVFDYALKYLSQSQSHHLINTMAHTEAATVGCAAAILQPYTCLITRSEVMCVELNLLRKDEKITNTNM